MWKFNIFYHKEVLFVYNKEIVVVCFLQEKRKIFLKILCCL